MYVVGQFAKESISIASSDIINVHIIPDDRAALFTHFSGQEIIDILTAAANSKKEAN
jgi:hypothetical protein